MATLLELAQNIPNNKRGKVQYNEEHYEVAVACLEGRITLKQFASVVSAKSGNGIYLLSLILREAHSVGYFTVSIVGKDK